MFKKKKVLVACEFSGTVRDAFLVRGHDAVSCDILPTESPGPHIVGDVTRLLAEPFDLVIAHPPCTYLANSGVRWLHSQPGRWELMLDAARFFRLFLDASAPHIAVENPVMHGHAKIRRPDFTVQPWQFGHGEVKRTCFWTKNLPPLEPTNNVAGRVARVHTTPPGPDRWKSRSVTYKGIAEAIAEQWGSV